MKNKFFLSFLLCLFLSSCDLFEDLFRREGKDTDPPYEAKIVWATNLLSNSFAEHTVDGDSVFFYERPPGYDTINIYALTRLNAETGDLIWRSKVIFNNIMFCQPEIIGNYVYVLVSSNLILCFNRETGEHTAKVQAVI
jgi:outer membrane protein assembly factor BamB